MATPRYRLARRAVADLEQIADYIGERNPSAADRVIDELIRSFELLSGQPEIGINLDELRPQLRMFQPSKPAANYLIFYYSGPDGITVSGMNGTRLSVKREVTNRYGLKKTSLRWLVFGKPHQRMTRRSGNVWSDWMRGTRATERCKEV